MAPIAIMSFDARRARGPWPQVVDGAGGEDAALERVVALEDVSRLLHQAELGARQAIAREPQPGRRQERWPRQERDPPVPERMEVRDGVAHDLLVVDEDAVRREQMRRQGDAGGSA